MSNRLLKKNKEAEKFWEKLNQGVQALINAYKKTKFLDSKDILNMKSSQGDMIFLHGHQIKDLLNGKRDEQREIRKYNESPYLIMMGHYHKLGVFSLDNQESIVLMNGCYLTPKIYFPELLSNIGEGKLGYYSGKFSLLIDRYVDNKQPNICKDYLKNLEILALEKRFEFFNNLKEALFILPGNHDAFDEVFVKATIAKLFFGMGDYVDLSFEEYSPAKEYCTNFFRENDFIPISKLNSQLDFNEIMSKLV